MEKSQQIECLRSMLHALEAGEEEQASHLFFELSKDFEHSLYKQIGSLTREIHETINGFQDEIKLSTLMDENIPSTQEGLEYVIKITEESTHKTMDNVEKGMLLCQRLKKQLQLEEVSTLEKHFHEILIAQGSQDLSGQIIEKTISITSDVEKKLLSILKLASESDKISKHLGIQQPEVKPPSTVSRLKHTELHKQNYSQNDVDNLLSDLGF